MKFSLEDFVRESNRIEGIHREATYTEVAAHEQLLALRHLGVADLCTFVAAVQPGAVLRNRPGLDVRVGNHYPPRGGAHVAEQLSALLYDADSRRLGAFDAHMQYETLHPFTDGNGRSGRALWLWHMGGIDRAPLGFLHHWYYQSLQAKR